MPESQYKINQDKYKARIGDKVKILCKSRNREAGWGTTWADEMNNTIGQTGTIIKIQDDIGIAVRPDNDPLCCYGRGFWWYPYFVLSLVR